MQQPNVILGFLFPADQNPPEAVEPTVRALAYPASRFETGFLFDCFGFVAARVDVRGEAELGQHRAHVVIIVSLVQTHALRPALCRPGTSAGNTLDGLADHPHAMPVASLDCQAARPAA